MPADPGARVPAELRSRIFDALADLDIGSAALDLPDGNFALIELNAARTWLITIEPARLVPTGGDDAK